MSDTAATDDAAPGRPLEWPGSSACPLVSVVVPIYNQGRFLADTLQSVQQQTYPHWECLCVDDGSTDDSARIIADFVRRDTRFVHLSQANAGVSSARNHALDHARGEFIQFLDGDDLLAPEKLQTQLQQIDHEQADISICAVAVDWRRPPPATISGFLPPKIQTDVFLQFLRCWEVEFVVPLMAFLFRAKLFASQRIRFDPTLWSHEDWDVWLRVMHQRPRVVTSSQRLTTYRVHAASATARRYRCWQGYLLSLKVQRRRYRDEPGVSKLLAEHRVEMRNIYKSAFPGRAWLVRRFLNRPTVRRFLPWPIQRHLRSFCGI